MEEKVNRSYGEVPYKNNPINIETLKNSDYVNNIVFFSDVEKYNKYNVVSNYYKIVDSDNIEEYKKLYELY